MLFNSLTYLLFLAVVFLFYWNSNRSVRLWVILVSSLVFYGFWRWEYVPIMLATVGISYLSALLIDSSSSATGRRRWLVTGVSANLAMLFYFKYSMFMLDNLSGISSYFGLKELDFSWQVVLPIGISFYTFQSISYIVDVYRGYCAPTRSFSLFAAYVTFFPQLVAGPILRSGEIMPQLEQGPRLKPLDLSEGLKLILSGLFLKVVLADNIAPFVDNAFAVPTATLSALDVWVMAFLFGFQIYFDFSAYSQIAIGSARLFGVSFPKNFDFPYFAASPRDFWKRWHISLSSWIRDYLYLPIAGRMPRDVSKGGLSVATDVQSLSQRRGLGALAITWMLMGLWHGASWTFALWGMWHCALIIVYRTVTRYAKETPVKWHISVVGWACTLPLVMLGWIPFRAETISDTFSMFKKVLIPFSYINIDQLSSGYLWAIFPINIDPVSYLVAAGTLSGMIIVWVFKKYIAERFKCHDLISFYFGVVVLSIQSFLVFIYLRPVDQFIYFQF